MSPEQAKGTDFRRGRTRCALARATARRLRRARVQVSIRNRCCCGSIRC